MYVRVIKQTASNVNINEIYKSSNKITVDGGQIYFDYYFYSPHNSGNIFVKVRNLDDAQCTNVKVHYVVWDATGKKLKENVDLSTTDSIGLPIGLLIDFPRSSPIIALIKIISWTKSKDLTVK